MTTTVRVPAYPYDVFELLLLPDGKGGLFRETLRLAEVEQHWDGWSLAFPGGAIHLLGFLPDEAITQAIDANVRAGTVTLTRVPSLEEDR